MALVYQKRKYGTVSHTYNCTTYMRNKDYCPRPITLLHRQIKSIVEQELRDLTKNINRGELIIKWIEKRKKDKLYQLTKKVYDNA